MKKLLPIASILITSFSLFSCGNNDSSKEEIYNVTFENNEFITFSGEETIKKGENYTFAFYKTDNTLFDYSNLKIIVNDAEVEFERYRITIPNVQSDLSIKASGIDYIYYSISFANNDFVEFHGESTVKANQNYSFTITKKNEEDADFTNMRVVANGTTINPNNGVYTISKVQNDITIVANGIKNLVQSVTFKPSKYFSFEGEGIARIGTNYSFKVTPNYDFIIADSIKVKVNETMVNKVGDSFVYENVQSDLIIEVTEFDVNDPTALDDDNKGDNPIEDLD